MKTECYNEDRRNESVRVLIVEKDPMVAAINKQFTEATNGFRVVASVSDGEEALAFVEQHPVDLVILALLLPDRGGLAVLQELRRQARAVDVIAISGVDDAQTVSHVLRQGVIAYLVKPFACTRLQAVLEAYYAFWLKLRQQSRLTQRDIDGICRVTESKVGEMPKNFSCQTMTLILQCLAERGNPLSADEVADGVRLSRTTTRRYLEYFQKTGRVERVIQYLAVGRPVHRFCLPCRTHEEEAAWSAG